MATDNAGNLISRGNKAYTYNNANRLSSYAEDGAIKATYGYNAQNQRTIKQASRTTHYHYGLDGKILATTEYNPDGSLYQRVEYLWLNDTPVAQVRMDYVADAVSARRLTYIHADHLNTPRAMSDSTQAIVWSWDSDAFGSLQPNNDPDGNLLVDKLALRFPGQLYDQESGLNINGFREYDPSLGRYALQSDPMGLYGGSWSTYAYLEGNPISRIDPLGLMGSTGHVNAPMVTTPGVFGCLIGCVSYSQGDSEAQASIEPMIGGGIEICSKPKPKPENDGCEKEPEKPKNCGIYDPNCDNKVQAPGVPVPRKLGIGAMLGVAVKADGSICTQIGAFTSGRFGLSPSLDLGGDL